MFQRIVAAIDSDPERSSKVVEAAGEMGRAFRSTVLVAHVREVERSAAMVATTARPGATLPALHLESEDDARRLVDDAVSRLRGTGVDARGEVGPGSGSTARELLDIANSFSVDLIVVGDRGSRVTDLLLGSVANRIVHLAACPVMLIR